MLCNLLKETSDASRTYTCIQRKLYLIKSLKANILIGNNIIGPKDILINISTKLAYISSYKITFCIDAK